MSSVAQAVQAVLAPESAQVLQFPSKPEQPRAKKVKAKKVGGYERNVSGTTAYMSKGVVRFLAQVRVKGRKAESKSFDDRTEAIAWRTVREAELLGTADKKLGHIPAKLTMSELFGIYVRESERHGEPLPQHQVSMFDRLSAHPLLQNVKVAEVSFSVVRDYFTARKVSDGMSPSTLQAEYARISVSIERCADWLQWGDDFIHPLTGARKKLMKAKLIADSKKRTRRPTKQERIRLNAYFAERKAVLDAQVLAGTGGSGGSVIPMGDITEVACINAFRLGEFPTLLWSTLDVKASTIECWRKDSESEETGAHKGQRKTLVPVLPAALAIILRQPRIEGEDRIFPFVKGTIGKQFSQAVKALKIVDLRFHDCRHEAITTASRFLNQSQLKALSGHKTDRHVARYINHSKEDISEIAAKGAEITSVV